MTTEEMTKLDRRVAELMGIPVIDCKLFRTDPPGVSVVPRFNRYSESDVLYYVTDPMQNSLLWQPTRDPRCERIVVEWVTHDKYTIVFQGFLNERYTCELYWGQNSTQASSKSPGIALCLAAVEAFGEKQQKSGDKE